MMKVLVVGGGGREHALAWKIRQSPKVGQLYCAPGNGGIAADARMVPLAADNLEGLLNFALEEGIDLTVVGPELPLTLGIVDLFQAAGLKIIGPTQQAARLEGSKVFAKEFMRRHGIPTAGYFQSSSPGEALEILERRDIAFPLVIKADGLAAGKGVIMAAHKEEARQAIREIMQERVLGAAGDQVLIEEFLVGEEISFLVFSDGVYALPMVPSQDHKRIFDEDQGPNTGGMGAYSRDSILSPDQGQQVMESIVYPLLRGMAAEGAPYRGILYVGLMLTREGPKVLEFNVRMGDPETQPVLFRLKSDLVEVFEAISAGSLDRLHLEWDAGCSVCVVLASGGYPGKYATGLPISGIEDAEKIAGVKVFHAGTALRDGKLTTSGGRVLGVTAVGPLLQSAMARAYQAVGNIHFEKMHYRHDIGAKGLRSAGE